MLYSRSPNYVTYPHPFFPFPRFYVFSPLHRCTTTLVGLLDIWKTPEALCHDDLTGLDWTGLLEYLEGTVGFPDTTCALTLSIELRLS